MGVNFSSTVEPYAASQRPARLATWLAACLLASTLAGCAAGIVLGDADEQDCRRDARGACIERR